MHRLDSRITASFSLPDEQSMICGYCQHTNIEGDHRCGRCGRRLTGTAGTGTRMMARAAGANALALAPLPELTAIAGSRQKPISARPADTRATEISMDAAATLDGLPPRRGRAVDQPSLFGAELQPRLIPFERPGSTSASSSAAGATSSATPGTVQPIAPSPVKAAARPALRRTPPVEDPQATLDFLPPLRTSSRILKTSAEAVIFCDAAVAGPIHRATAAALDLIMIGIACGTVLLTFEMVGKPAECDRLTVLLLCAMCGMIALFYGSLFAIAGSVTPGMRWTHLRLITFDGFPLDGRCRGLRFAGAWLSVLSGGIGLLWALLDEENLTWHDHISKTFPTLRESESNVVRQRRG